MLSLRRLTPAVVGSAVFLTSLFVSSGQVIATFPNDPRYGDQYGPDLVNAPLAWAQTLGSADVKVCLVDTGVDFPHEDLEGPRYLGGHDFTETEFPENQRDFDGHGTRMAGIALASINNAKGIAGLAQASYLAAKVDVSGFEPDYEQVAAGIRWCADQGAHVIGMSFGGPRDIQSVREAIGYASNLGSVMVSAADGYPGNYSEVIAVTCVDGQRNRCPSAPVGANVELAAPGWNILTTALHNLYASSTGTSPAVAHVVGVAALVKSGGPTLTAGEIRNLLTNTAEDLGALGRDDTFGFGLIDAGAAVRIAADGCSRGECEPPPPDNGAEPPPPPCGKFSCYASGESGSRVAAAQINKRNDNPAVAVQASYQRNLRRLVIA